MRESADHEIVKSRQLEFPMPLFRKGLSRHDLVVSMAGVKMGDRVLQLSCGDGRVLAALAARVGLTGRACAVDDTNEGRRRAEAAAARAGVLVEIERVHYSQLPYEAGSFDLVVVWDLVARLRAEERVRCLQESWRVLRPGGRCVIVEPAPRGGLGALLGRGTRNAEYTRSGGAEPALRAEGFRAVRTLAEREGLRFVEGARPGKIEQTRH